MIRLHPFLAIVAAAVVSPSMQTACYSHDLWLIPPTDSRQPGEKVSIGFAVGMDFPNSVHPASPARLTVGILRPDGELADATSLNWTIAEDTQSQLTSGTFVPDSPGVWMVTAVTQASRIEMDAGDFNRYLLHDGLPHVLGLRMDNGELNRAARERYSKYTKALVVVDGEAKAAVATQRVGMKLEIVPLANPLEVNPGETLEVQVWFDDAPLARANLCWDEPGNGEAFSGQTWTNDEGRAVIPVSGSGLRTLRLVHMIPGDSDDIDYESFWSSFTWNMARQPDAK